MSVSKEVEEQFGFAAIQVVSFADLYAGKIVAALDRQHPRDLFDLHDLLVNEGITDKVITEKRSLGLRRTRIPRSCLQPLTWSGQRYFVRTEKLLRTKPTDVILKIFGKRESQLRFRTDQGAYQVALALANQQLS